jgi:hypothetical protein
MTPLLAWVVLDLKTCRKEIISDTWSEAIGGIETCDPGPRSRLSTKDEEHVTKRGESIIREILSVVLSLHA